MNSASEAMYQVPYVYKCPLNEFGGEIQNQKSLKVSNGTGIGPTYLAGGASLSTMHGTVAAKLYCLLLAKECVKTY